MNTKSEEKPGKNLNNYKLPEKLMKAKNSLLPKNPIIPMLIKNKLQVEEEICQLTYSIN